MHARDQSSIFSTRGKFRPDYGLLLELHALTLVARSYALLILPRGWYVCACGLHFMLYMCTMCVQHGGCVCVCAHTDT